MMREAQKTRQGRSISHWELGDAQETIQTLQARYRDLEARCAEEKRALRKELSAVKETLSETNARHAAAMKDAEAAHAARHDALAEAHVRSRRELATLQGAVPTAAGDAGRDLASYAEEEHAEAARALVRQHEDSKEKWRRDSARAYGELEASKDQQIANLKEQSAFFLRRKEEELREYVREVDAYKKHKERETTQLRNESEYLHRWALAMNALVGNVESGAYPAREIGGLRKLTIPARDKPGSLDVEVLKRKADAATRFLETMNLPTASAGGGGSLRSTGNSVGGLSTAAPGDFDGLETKASLAEDERAAIEERTLRELSSHPTIEYIRALEEENDRANKELSQHRRRASEQHLALMNLRRREREETSETLGESMAGVSVGRDLASARARSENAAVAVAFGKTTGSSKVLQHERGTGRPTSAALLHGSLGRKESARAEERAMSMRSVSARSGRSAYSTAASSDFQAQTGPGSTGYSRSRPISAKPIRRVLLTLVPIRPRSRGERQSLRTFAGVSLRPLLAFNPRPRRLSTPLLTPFNSTPTFARMERPSASRTGD